MKPNPEQDSNLLCHDCRWPINKCTCHDPNGKRAPASRAPSDPLGVAAVTLDPKSGKPIPNFWRPADEESRLAGWHWDFGWLEEIKLRLSSDEAQCSLEAIDEVLSIVLQHYTETTTPPREPAEGETPLTDAVCNECIGLKKDATVALVLRNHARKLETALAEAKAQLASITPLTNGDIRLVRDLVLKNQDLRAENERLAVLVEESETAFANYRRIILGALDAAQAETHHPDIGAPVRKPLMPQERIAWLRTQLTAAQAQIAAKDSAIKLTIDRIEWFAKQSTDGNTPEWLDASLKEARAALSPSCGAELLEELERLRALVKAHELDQKDMKARFCDHHATPGSVAPGCPECARADLTARNAKLEEDEKRLDWLDTDAGFPVITNRTGVPAWGKRDPRPLRNAIDEARKQP